MKVIDATNLILGRMACIAAKSALKGEEVAVVNCEKAVISGNKKKVLEKFKHRRERGKGGKWGPFYPRMPDRIVKRAIKGMLPKKHWSEKSRGRLALGRIKCYIGLPDEFKDKKIETITKADKSKLKINSVSIKEIAKLLGAKW